jgi:hypothetical protein
MQIISWYTVLKIVLSHGHPEKYLNDIQRSPDYILRAANWEYDLKMDSKSSPGLMMKELCD